MPQTPRLIITIIVSTLAGASLLYIGTLAYCVMAGLTVVPELLREFSTAGMFLLGVFCGLLSKTSSNPEPTTATQTTVTKTEPEPDK